MNGSNNKKQQQKARADTASNQTRLQIIRAAKEASWNGKESKGTQLVWGSVSNRTNGANDAGWVRVGDKSIRVRNPSTKFLALPIGYPAMLDMGKIWKGYGGGAITEKALVIPPIAKLDMLKIEAARTKAHCLDFDNEKIFEENFTHCYYGSSEQNEMRGKIIYDQDSEKLGIMVMEKATGGNWVTAGKIPIKEENILTRGKLRLGTTVSFTTQIRDKTVFAHKISPCALLDPNGREHNTYTQLPNSISSILDPTYVSMLKTPAGKRLEDDRAELLVASLEKDYIKKLGEERWKQLDPEMCHTVDILVSDNDHSESDNYLGAAVINFTELIIKFQNGRQRQQSPFCWDVMKNLLSEDEVGLLEKKFEETKIGMTMVVEVDESHQKLALLWANNTIERVVNDRGRTTTYVDTIAVTYGFGPYIDSHNFWEILNDESFQPGILAGLQSIKIFDKLVPVEVTFQPLQADDGQEKHTVYTDRATRGLVVLTVEAVSNRIPEGQRLEVIPTEVDTIATSLLNSQYKFETHIKFRTTTENLLLFNHICRIYNIITFFDNNPPRQFGKKKAVSWRTVRFLTTGWTDDMFSSLLAEISNSEDFFIMKKADIIGKGDKDSITTFTVVSENHRSGRMLAALKLQFPELQAMCMNNFITRIAVRGKLDFASLEAGINRVNRVFPHSVRKIVFENKTFEFYAPSAAKEQNVTSYKPHFSKYVSALAGFYTVLDRQEVAAFLSLAGVEVKDATLTWFYNTAEQDYVLQIQTDCPELTKQLQGREGGQHDVVTFLKWSHELGSSLKFAGVLDIQNTPKKTGNEINPVSKKRRILTAKQVADLTEAVEVVEEKAPEAWQQVRGKKKQAEKPPPQTEVPKGDAAAFLNNNFNSLQSIEEGMQDVDIDDEDEKEEETTEKEVVESEKGNEGAKQKAATQRARSKIITSMARRLFKERRVNTLNQATLLIQNKERNLYDTGMSAQGVHENLQRLAQLGTSELYEEVREQIVEGDDNDTTEEERVRKRSKVAVGSNTVTQPLEDESEQPAAEEAGDDNTTGGDGTKRTSHTGIAQYFGSYTSTQVEVPTTTSLMHDSNNDGGGQ